AAGDDDVQAGPAAGERREDSAEVDVIVAQCDVELVEHQQLDRRILHQLGRAGPGTLRSCDITCAILGFPGKAFAQRVPFDLIAKTLDRAAFAGLPGALAELYHAALKAAPDGAQQKAKGRRRFALALSGVDDEQPLLD